MIKDHIKFNKNFQYSINLEYDLENREKIDGFIPTKTSLNLIKEMLKHSVGNGSRSKDATLLVGPYGKGKSHLLLIMLELLADKNFKKNKKLLTNIKKLLPDYHEEILKYKKTKYLPVVITGGYGSFETTLMMAVKMSLNKRNIKIDSLKTFFEEAIVVLEDWQRQEKSSEILNQKLQAKNYTLELMIEDLDQYKEKALEVFKDIYKEITFGVEFEPLVKNNAVKVIEDIQRYLEEKTDFDGLYIVFDEFSKFLESKAAWKNLNEIQNLAELAARTKLGFTCVTHKKIGAYTHELTEEEKNNWRKIEGRFKAVYFEVYDDAEYYYYLIEKALEKKSTIYEKYKELINKSRKLYLKSPLSAGLGVDERLVIEGAFPLNAYTTYSLIKLSERIAQNERSIFTYLCKDEKYSLIDVLSENKLIGIDKLYDYFKPLFDADKESKIHRIHLQSEAILEKLETESEIAIIKAMAILKMIDDKKIMTAVEENIRRALSLDSISLELDNLIEKNLIFKKSSDNSLAFLAGSGVNINEQINHIKKLKLKSIKIEEKLNEYYANEYIVPKRYNSNYKMTRFFKKVFVSEEKLLDGKFDIDKYTKNIYADGFIFQILNSKESKDLEYKLTNEEMKNKIFIIPKKSRDYTSIVENIEAIKILKADKKFIDQDMYLRTELDMLLADNHETLNAYIVEDFENIADAKIIGKNVLENETITKSDLNRYVSRLCEESYPKAPIINYELINKRNITTQMLKARNFVIEALLENKVDFIENTTSAQYVLYHVLIKKNGLDKNNDIAAIRKNREKNDVAYEKLDVNLLEILEVIDRFVKISESEKQSIDELYCKLQSEPYGMRKGVISVYLALVMSFYGENLVVLQGDSELPLSVDIINQIDTEPSTFSLRIETETKEKIEYLQKLDELFGNPHRRTTDYSFKSVVSTIQKYFQNLPYFTKNTKKQVSDGELVEIDKKILGIRNEFLSYEINSRELIFDRMPKKYYRNYDLIGIADEIKNVKTHFDMHINNVSKYLESKIIEMFSESKGLGLGSSLKYWARTIEESKLKYSSNNLFSEFYYYVANLNGYSTDRILNDISIILTKTVIEDWNDKILQNMLAELGRIKIEGEKLKEASDIEYDEEYLITIKTKKDGLREKVIEKEPLSDMARALSEELEDVLLGYDSLEDKELQNALLNILEKTI